jgi:hypothetical protein
MQIQLERDHLAKGIRLMRKLLQSGQPVYDNEPKTSMLSKVLFAGLVTGLVLIGSCSVCHAYTDQDAIKTIVGEASNQSFKGMVCVAEVIRHNSSLRGFYGLHASHSLREGAKTWAMAKKAWIASLNTNYTRGANHFENIHAFGQPYWVAKCIKTYTWKDHVFYKEGV